MSNNKKGSIGNSRKKRLRKNESLRSLGDNTKIKFLNWDKKYHIKDSIEKIYLHYLDKIKISNIEKK